MTEEKRRLYQKAYVELYEMIKSLSRKEQEKIPKYFIEYIFNNRDVNYNFHIDKNRGLLEQDYMIETKALIVKLYEKYFAPESENEIWKKYHRICFNMIDNEKKKKHNPEDLFKKEQIKAIEHKDILPVKYKKESIFQRIMNFFKNKLS